jgi:hypothetical protein
VKEQYVLNQVPLCMYIHTSHNAIQYLISILLRVLLCLCLQQLLLLRLFIQLRCISTMLLGANWLPAIVWSNTNQCWCCVVVVVVAAQAREMRRSVLKQKLHASKLMRNEYVLRLPHYRYRCYCWVRCCCYYSYRTEPRKTLHSDKHNGN